MTEPTKKYGVWVNCCSHCGWFNILKVGDEPKPGFKCLCCSRINDNAHEWYFEEHPATAIVSLTDVKSRKVQEIARNCGFLVHRDRGQGGRTTVYRIECPMTVGYHDGQKRAFMGLEQVYKGSWQRAMAIIREKIKDDLPEYLK